MLEMYFLKIHNELIKFLPPPADLQITKIN